MRARRVVAGACACLGLLAAGASATPPLTSSPAAAEGAALEIVGPDQAAIAGTGAVDAPPATVPTPTPFAYPEDGSIVSAASTSVTTTASPVDGTASALSEVTTLSLFKGEITADAVRGSVTSAGTVGGLAGSTITNLVVLGQPIGTPGANARIPLADWGYAVLLGQSTSQGSGAQPSWRGTITALLVHLDADHGGLLAGTEIRVGFADAFAQTPPTPTTTAATTAPTTTTTTSRPRPQAPVEKPTAPSTSGLGADLRARATDSASARAGTGPVVVAPPDVTPQLTANHYVFPVYGPAGYGDTFGAPRGDVSGGWHHGDDIFASLGSPVLAVADGTVFSVGWNDVGGYRLWLRDEGGNEFYYAHLSAYTTLAVDGRRVHAGDVLGFVGNTGDAQGTPYHLHFEVHPVAMLFLGYDGAVDPTKYLEAWKRLEDIRILPAIPFAGSHGATPAAPAPGAILLESSDISTANGLDPDSLVKAMNGPPTVELGPGGVSRLPVPLPVLDRA
ncbi:MAG TPA: M23 family metallopeptidase [Gaiellaceae bacterium]|nr:M23 family metallopeptidase [Gaiellaceae bacterium]